MVIITVPIGVSDEVINAILKKHRTWILTKLAKFKSKPQIPPRELCSGENFEYLGRNYRLKISQSIEPSVKLIGGYLHINVFDKDDYKQKLQLIDKWYLKRAKYYFMQIINKYSSIIAMPINKVSIKKMTTRWGSCNHNAGFINLNIELIKKHPRAIEYVIFHEMVHLIHNNHNKSFYTYLTTHMPDWQLRRQKLYD
jgi:hypothetical protein